MNQAPYSIPSQALTVSQEIKKSRFITFAEHTPSISESDDFLRSVRQQYPDARHHCWARVVGAPNDSMTYGFSDDGEPSGTAGKPMLQQLLGSKIGEITVVVVRYFGGIKLGTGGLVRAYGSSVQQVFDELTTTLKIPTVKRNVSVPFDLTGAFEHLVKQIDATIESRDYGNSVVCHVSVAESDLGQFGNELQEKGKGRIRILKE